MDWEMLFLKALKESRPDWDEKADWRAAYRLYDGLSAAEQADLDQTVLRMIDIDYINPHSSKEARPFDEVMIHLPAGMTPDDLLCIEGAIMVAAERGLGEAYFKFNRLMRLPRWHALYPRLEFLPSEGFAAQRKLAETDAGRYVGAMVGVAAGDALGVTVEFMSRRQVRQAYPEGLREIVGGGVFGLEPGQWSDDTAMTLAMARGIAENPEDPVEAVGRHFMEWFNSCPPDVGNTCRLALDTYRRTGSWQEASETVSRELGDRAAGNGALMRTVPTALAYGSDTNQAVRLASMTHPHPESDAAVMVYHRAVAAALRGGASKEAVVAEGLAAAGPPADRLSRLSGLTEDEIRSSGYVVDTLEAALWSFLVTDSLEECIVKAVNLGDDADTVGAVAGGLAGAYYGIAALPRRWSLALKGRADLEEAAERLYDVNRRLSARS